MSGMPYVSRGVKRAAMIVELEDGTRMLYSFKPGRPLTFSAEPLDDADYLFRPLLYVPPIEYQLTVEGIMQEGTIWTAPMPGDDETPEVESTRQEIER